MGSPSPSPSVSAAPPDGPERSLTGAVLGGRYELRALVGRGGMGEVYEAADPVLDRTVAVKVLRPELAADRRSAARFEREARMAARLSHPRIVAVYDAGRHDDRVFIVMEHVAGPTLVDVLHRGGPLGAATVAGLGADVADALAHAHERGVVHRDVTPGNVMLDGEGQAKVLDFGIARAAKGVPSSTSVHGTIAYAAPEVLAGDQGDQRVDVYGLGAVLYELLTGAPPFRGGDAEIERRLRVRRPVPIRGWTPDVPPELDELVMRLLAFEPTERPENLRAVARTLREIAASPTAAVTAPFLTAPAPIDGPERPQTPVLVPRTRRLDDVVTTDAPEGDDPAATGAEAGRRGGRPGRIVAWLALLAAIAGAGAIVVPSVLGVATPVRTEVPPPPQLPAPADLTAATSCDGWFSTGATVSWSAVPSATGYEIWRRGTAGGWRLAGTVGSDATAARDPDLGVDTTYTYRVRALDGRAVGAWSVAASAATPLLCLT